MYCSTYESPRAAIERLVSEHPDFHSLLRGKRESFVVRLETEVPKHEET